MLPDRVFASLRRRTTSGRFIPQIDGLRCVAIAAVVMLHVLTALAGTPQAPLKGREVGSRLAAWVGDGGVGVPLFFVISGCILAVPFASHALADGPRVSVRAYFWRRLTRLEPPYVISLLMFFVLRGLHDGRHFQPLVPHLIAGLFYQHGAVFGVVNPVNYVTWSLEVEVQFYILAPLFAAIYYVPRAGLRRGMIVAAIVVATVIAGHWFDAFSERSFLPLWVAYFWVGMLVADIYVGDWRSQPPERRVADLVGVAAWAGVAWSVMHPAVRDLALAPLFGIGMVTALTGLWLRRVFGAPIVATIGGMCYSIYLLHYWLLEACAHALASPLQRIPSFDVAYSVACLVLAPIVLLVCGTFFVLIEQPCMDRRWPERLVAALKRARRGHASEAALAE